MAVDPISLGIGVFSGLGKLFGGGGPSKAEQANSALDLERINQNERQFAARHNADQRQQGFDALKALFGGRMDLDERARAAAAHNTRVPIERAMLDRVAKRFGATPTDWSRVSPFAYRANQNALQGAADRITSASDYRPTKVTAPKTKGPGLLAKLGGLFAAGATTYAGLRGGSGDYVRDYVARGGMDPDPIRRQPLPISGGLEFNGKMSMPRGY